MYGGKLSGDLVRYIFSMNAPRVSVVPSAIYSSPVIVSQSSTGMGVTARSCAGDVWEREELSSSLASLYRCILFAFCPRFPEWALGPAFQVMYGTVLLKIHRGTSNRAFYRILQCQPAFYRGRYTDRVCHDPS